MKKQPKAVSLISGGLDSMLATKLILDQGVHVEGINFFTGFCVEGHTHAIRQKDKDKKKRNNALWVAEQLGIKLHIIDVVEPYKEVLINPKHGYGAHLNPCLDCKVFMVRQAYEWIHKHDFDFIITGEVVGQRPMSQRKQVMPVVAKESGAETLLVRPLSAKNLPMTKPEVEGWIDREKLHGISGRTRKPQIALAQQYGMDDFAQPAGGCCFLTDRSYSKKLGDLWGHRGHKDYELDDIMLLKVGRHLRPKANFKMIIGREEGENNFMEGYKREFTHMKTVSHVGPLALVDGTLDAGDAHLAARILARFSQGKEEKRVDVVLHHKDMAAEGKVISVEPMREQDVRKDWYV